MQLSMEEKPVTDQSVTHLPVTTPMPEQVEADPPAADLPAADRSSELVNLIDELRVIRQSMLDLEALGLRKAGEIHPSYLQSARNLFHYLALRRREMRPIQERLSALGLSSLGRTESHVLTSVNKVLDALHRLAQMPAYEPAEPAPINSYEEGRALLEQHTEALLGPPPSRRTARIMVTMPSEAADSPRLIERLLANGMDCMRINCAHDDASVWKRMIEHLRSAEQSLGRKCRVLMDLAGPKLRTGPVEPGPQVLKWRPQRNSLGEVLAPARIWLYPEEQPTVAPTPAAAILPVSGLWLEQVNVGDQIDFKDQRGSRRHLQVVEKIGQCFWLEADKTAYVTPSTVLQLGSKTKKERSGQKSHEAKLGALPAQEQFLLLKKGDTLILTNDDVAGRPAQLENNGKLISPAQIGCTLPAIFSDVRVGESIWFDDGKIGGVIDSVESRQITVRITQARDRGEKLRGDKGINLPDSTLRLPALTEKDIRDLPFVVAHADIVGYSFVRNAADVDELESRLKLLGGGYPGIILKIETREAFQQLPALLAASMRTPCDGVMIARGDLAIECGFERMAEVQEQILWICEAAHVPVIWATQVLESVAKDGLASRAEVSDAASSQRAECVMLNKGEHIVKALQTLDNILQRMQSHQHKKRSMLRPLELAHRFPRE
jgi:pyruvate kinase